MALLRAPLLSLRAQKTIAGSICFRDAKAGKQGIIPPLPTDPQTSEQLAVRLNFQKIVFCWRHFILSEFTRESWDRVATMAKCKYTGYHRYIKELCEIQDMASMRTPGQTVYARFNPGFECRQKFFSIANQSWVTTIFPIEAVLSKDGINVYSMQTKNQGLNGRYTWDDASLTTGPAYFWYRYPGYGRISGIFKVN